MKRVAIAAGHFLLLSIIICLTAAGQSAPEQKLIPLPIELPKPSLEGTPANLRVTRLEKPTKRGPFLAPAGVTNLAMGKKVTSSDEDAFPEDLEFITDGDKTQVEGNFVELGRGVQYITIDLGSSNEIYGILFWHYHAPRAYFATVVQIAEDPGFSKNVRTLFSNDMENATNTGVGKDFNYLESFQGKLVDAKGSRGRYVRLYSNGNSANELNHYMEVEVYGRPVS